MLFDRPAALPVAQIVIEQGRSRSHVATAASRWRGLRGGMWRWLHPRLVPLAVALTGMFAVLGSAEYLTRLARRTPEQSLRSVQHEQLATLKLDSSPAAALGDEAIDGVVESEDTSIVIVNGPVGAELTLDRNQLPIGRMVQLPSGGSMPIRLVPSR